MWSTSSEAPSLPSYRKMGKSNKYMKLSVRELPRQHLEKENLLNVPKPLPTHLSGVDLCSIFLSATVVTTILISPVPS